MPRRKKKRQAPPLLLGKRLVLDKSVQLGGLLYAALRDLGDAQFSVAVYLRNAPGGDLTVFRSPTRGTAQDAVHDVELFLPRLASALRQAGAS